MQGKKNHGAGGAPWSKQRNRTNLTVNRRTPRKENHTTNFIGADSHDIIGILNHHEVRLLSLEFY